MKKAFTLIELLATIAILGVIGLITTLSVNKIIKINKQKLYDAEVVNIIEAAKLYYTDHTEYLPSNNTSTCVSLKRLQDNKLIDKNISNPITGNSFLGTFAVTVKNDNNSYDYDVSDTCDSTMMAYDSSKAYWQEAYRANIVNATFLDNINNVPTTCDYTNNTLCWDVSNKQDKSIVAYLQANAIDNTMYDLFIAGKGQIYFNENSSYYFYRMGKLEYINNLNKILTEYVTNMSYMFAGCKKLTLLDLSNFDTSKVVYLMSMFDCNNGGYNVSNYDEMQLQEIIGIDNLNTSNAVNMSKMFFGCTNLTILDLNKYDTSKVIDMSRMFAYCRNLISLKVNAFNTSNVTNMTMMFTDCRNLISLEVNGFNTSNVTDMSYMFSDCGKLTSLNLSNFNTSKVTNMRWMFMRCILLETLNVSNFNTSKVTDMSWMFESCRLTTLDVSNFDTSNVTDMSYMFRFYKGTTLDVSNFNTSKATNMAQMFAGIKYINILDLTGFNTKNVTNMSGMFGYTGGGRIHSDADFICGFEKIKGIENFDTSKVTDMSKLFAYCKKLTSLDLRNFDTSNVVNMAQMFIECKELISLNLTSFNTSNVTNMTGMFYWCKKIAELDLSSFNTSNVKLTGGTDDVRDGMFNSCILLTTIYIGSGWNMSSVTDSTYMFYGCVNLPNFTSTVVDKTNAFAGTGGYLTLKA